ncbi:hypothetical protein CPB84DRAFT_1792482, partial [Gymnopilus junonius]
MSLNLLLIFKSEKRQRKQPSIRQSHQKRIPRSGDIRNRLWRRLARDARGQQDCAGQAPECGTGQGKRAYRCQLLRGGTIHL